MDGDDQYRQSREKGSSGTNAAVLFTAFRDLPVVNRRIQVCGHFASVRSENLCFDPSGQIHNETPFVYLSGTQHVALASITTDALTRDLNVAKFLFKVGERKRELTIKVCAEQQKIRTCSAKKWEWTGTIAVGENGLRIEVTLVVAKEQTVFGHRLSATLLKPLRIRIADLGFSLRNFLLATKVDGVLDEVELDWSTVIQIPDSSSKAQKKVVIAGGGIAGLSAAHVLISRGFDVVVCEKDGVLGGKLNSYVEEATGHTVEHGIHGVFPAYRNLKRLWALGGIPETVYTKTTTFGMARNGGMATGQLDEAKGAAPFFLLRLIPRGVLGIKETLLCIPILFKAYGASLRKKGGHSTADSMTFAGMLERSWTGRNAARFVLLPYLKNLTYARAEEVSAQFALDALGYYVLENADDVRAEWLKAGPQAVVIGPWVKELTKQGVKFLTRTPVERIALEGERFLGLETQIMISEAELGSVAKIWVEWRGQRPLGLNWSPETSKLLAWDARCTHEGCPLTADNSATGKGFRCDCHGGRFDAQGKVKRAPPKQDLTVLPCERVEVQGQAYWRIETSPPGQVHADNGPQENIGLVSGDYGVIALDILALQKVLDRRLLACPSLSKIPLLRATAVMVLRMWFVNEWTGPDSGVFASDDFLDNFFVLGRFQPEFNFRTIGMTVVECHIADSELVQSLPDSDILERACQTLAHYFAEFNLSNLNIERSRVLRHHDIFPLFAPADHAKLPAVHCDEVSNLFFAGDWVRSKHRSFFMERSAVTGIEAANGILLQEKMALEPILRKARPQFLVRLMSLPVRFTEAMKKSLQRLVGFYTTHD